MKICFTDIDGVLNCQSYFNSLTNGCCYNELDENRVKLLAEIISKTNAEIVLTSTWRELKDMGEMGEPHPMYVYLEETFEKYGLSIMFHTPILDMNRPLEIYTWLNNRADTIENFVILDDDFGASYYRYYGLDKNLVKTTWFENGGLHPEHVERAIKILNGGD